MNTAGFLEQLLSSAKSVLAEGSEQAQSLSDRVERDGVGGLKLGKFAQGALAGGALSLLLGSRSGRRLATYGGLAALGTLAYRAWREPQEGGAVATIEPHTVDRLPAPEVEQHSRGILVALIGAAKADGHIDARERQLIHDEVARLSQDVELRDWLDAELERSLDAAAVAARATTPELAVEMYLASVLVVDETNAMERVYIDELARELKLDPGLRKRLDSLVSRRE